MRRGGAPKHFGTGSGSVIRRALQTLEAIKWVEKSADGGRVLSKQVRILMWCSVVDFIGSNANFPCLTTS